jgi:hypothetical protein
LIVVPATVVLSDAETFLNQADWELRRDAEVEIAFEGGGGFVEPWALAAICAFAFACARHDMAIQLTNLEGAAEPMRMGIAKFLREGNGEEDEVEPAGRYIPLRQIQGTNDLRLLFADVVPLLHLDAAPEQAQAVQYSVSEMVRNVLEHSQSPDGAVAAAELYPASETRQAHVSIGIADCGSGIRRSLSRNFPDIQSDRDAVLTALKPGTSGATRGIYGTADNAGAGLFFTRRLATTADGQFGLLSGDAFLRASPADGDAPDEQLARDIPRYPGTVVAVEIGIEEPFEWAEFLTETREAFVEMASRSAKQAARRARFE